MKNYDEIGDYPQAIRDAFANFCDHSEERSAEECSDARAYSAHSGEVI